jgi:hypothetical protein
MRALLPANEHARLAAVREQEILDTPPERPFDDIVQLAQVICDMPTALVTIIDAERQWFKARVGIDIAETARERSRKSAVRARLT